MRSLLIGIYELDVREILVIGHTDCGAMCINGEKLIEKMKEHGISQKQICLLRDSGINLDSWLGCFTDLSISIKNSVEVIRQHPLIPKENKGIWFNN